MAFEKSYEIVKGPPPMEWDTYSRRLQGEWTTLLESLPDEAQVQRFLEQHPCLLPGAFGMMQAWGHYPFPGAVVTQPILNGLGERIPDFMWIATNSGEVYPTLIEIESPTKRAYRNDDVPTAELTQAMNQILEWKMWFGKPENMLVFMRHYGLPEFLRARKFHPLYILIYGRRKEIAERPQLAELRANAARQDEFIMSFDRLSPSYDARDMMCVSKRGAEYVAVSIPPTIQLGPLLAEAQAPIQEKESAAGRCSWASPERREFLARRFPYWDSWARAGARGVISIGDVE